MSWKKDIMRVVYDYGSHFKKISNSYLKNVRNIDIKNDFVYVPNNLNSLLKYLKQEYPKYKIDQLKHLGILSVNGKGKLYQRIYGLMIPHRNRFGEIIFCNFRNITDEKWRYMNTRGTNKYPYNIFNCNTEKELFITEGAIDALSLMSIGVNNCISLSTNHLQEGHRNYVKKFKRITLCLDGDNAGKTGSNNSFWKAKSWGVKNVKIRKCLFDDINAGIQLGVNDIDKLLGKPFEPIKKIYRKNPSIGVDNNPYIWYNKVLKIDEVAEKLGMERCFNKYYCPSPDHNDSDPSLVLFYDKNEFYCYGCGAVGGSVRLIKYALGLELSSKTDIEAYDWIEKNLKKIYTGAISNESYVNQR